MKIIPFILCVVLCPKGFADAKEETSLAKKVDSLPVFQVHLAPVASIILDPPNLYPQSSFGAQIGLELSLEQVVPGSLFYLNLGRMQGSKKLISYQRTFLGLGLGYRFQGCPIKTYLGITAEEVLVEQTEIHFNVYDDIKVGLELGLAYAYAMGKQWGLQPSLRINFPHLKDPSIIPALGFYYDF